MNDRSRMDAFADRARFFVAGIWLVFGLLAKVLDLVPRHRLIVARVLGDQHAAALTTLVGFGEISMALWVLGKRWPRACAAVQTGALAGMNALEIWKARDLLLAPLPMVLANLGLMSLAWFCALSFYRRAADPVPF